jgi:hypothetical protein
MLVLGSLLILVFLFYVFQFPLAESGNGSTSDSDEDGDDIQQLESEEDFLARERADHFDVNS